jgi:hypothetical protein
MASVRASARVTNAYTRHCDRVQVHPPRADPGSMPAALNTFRFFISFYILFIAFSSICSLFYMPRVNYRNKKR